MKKEYKDFLMIAAVATAAYFILRSFLNSIRNAGANVINDTPVAIFTEVRTTDAIKAIEGIKKLKYLTESFYVKAEQIFNTAAYDLDYMGTTQSNEIAKEIGDADSWLPTRIFDNSAKALTAILKIKNQVQAAEVTHSYFMWFQDDLGKSLGFMDNRSVIIAYEHLKSLPTGVRDKTTGTMLTQINL